MKKLRLSILMSFLSFFLFSGVVKADEPSAYAVKKGEIFSITMNEDSAVLSPIDKNDVNLKDAVFITSEAKDGNLRFKLIDINGKALKDDEVFEGIWAFGDLYKVLKEKKYGLLSKRGETVLEPAYDSISPIQNGISIISKDGKSGLIAEDGKKLTACKYLEIHDFKEGLASVATGSEGKKKYGFINLKGVEIVKPKYTEARSFHEGMAVVAKKGKAGNQYGYINKSGREAVPLKYFGAADFKEGRGLVQLSNSYGFVDKKGKLVISGYVFAESFEEGLAKVNTNYRSGFVNKEGKEVIRLMYTDANSFHDGLAMVSKGGRKYGYINKKGNSVIKESFNHPGLLDDIGSFKNGFAVINKNNWYGMIDKKGKSVVPAKYYHIDNISEGFARVLLKGKHGYVDMKGKEVIPVKYKDGKNDSPGFKGGMVAVSNGKKFAYFNKKGEQVTKFKYDETYGFSGDTALVKIGKKEGHVGRDGEEVIPVSFDTVDRVFTGGRAFVLKNKRFGLYHISGKEVFAPDFDFIYLSHEEFSSPTH